MIERQDCDYDIIEPYNKGDDFYIKKNGGNGCITNVQRQIYKHSPTGFNFGYPGSGPADFALNLLLMIAQPATAQKYYQEFKFKYLQEDGDELVISYTEVIHFLKECHGR